MTDIKSTVNNKSFIEKPIVTEPATGMLIDSLSESKKIEKDNSQMNAKKRRIPVGKQKRYDYSGLNLDKKNFHYHWVNVIEGGNNISRYEMAGYEAVMDKKGKIIKRGMGKYQEGCQHLMRLPIDLYNEDQVAKLEEPREIEADMLSKGYSSRQIGHGSNPNFLVGDVKISQNHVDPTINKK